MKFILKEMHTQVLDLMNLVANNTEFKQLADTLWEASVQLRRAKQLATAIDDAANALRITGTEAKNGR